MHRIFDIFLSAALGQRFRNGLVWLHGKNLARRLEFPNPDEAIRANTDEEDWQLIQTGRDGKHEWFVNEYGIWGLILAANSSEAREYRRFLARKLLPSVHKYGIYIDPSRFSPEDIRAIEFVLSSRNPMIDSLEPPQFGQNSDDNT
jgi:prophage antirepressor-like protein